MKTKLNFNQKKEMNNFHIIQLQNKQFEKFNVNVNLNVSGMTNDITTTDTDLSLKNNIFNKFEQKEDKSYIIIKNPDKFLNELFKIYSEENCLCNYMLFEKSINIKIDLDKEMIKLTLLDYFDFFNKASIYASMFLI